jgi:DNA (cytosine-5)-methyltransferase 1
MEQQDSESDMESETFDAGSDSQSSGVLLNILSDLEQAGYSVQIFIIPACAVNAPHRRDRVWIVANFNSIGLDDGKSDRDRSSERTMATDIPNNRNKIWSKTSGCNSELNNNAANTKSERGELWKSTENNREEFQERLSRCDNSNVADSLFIGQQGQGEYSSSGYSEKESHRETIAITSSDAREHDWNEPWLEVATRLCRVDDGLPRKLDRVNRLKALGNAIVPQVAYEIMKAILETVTGKQQGVMESE